MVTPPHRLRTGNIYSPWPEEMNRLITGRIARYNFAPTPLSKQNLLKENVPEESISVTGNTVIDALHDVIYKLNADKKLSAEIEDLLLSLGYDLKRLSPLKDNAPTRRLILITGHRRENFGDGFLHICNAIKNLASRNSDVDFVYPVHLNPNVRKPVFDILNGMENVFLIEPLDYLPFVYLMEKSYLILTDSGGVQEEAPGLGKPVLVMRNTTERPEAVEAGTVLLVGTNQNNIEDGVSRLLTDQALYTKMSEAINPYGDGHAAQRIVDFLSSKICI